ncbi:class II glutamine amidotransferase [Salisaeta longa]|uniref:class II glutamine amidotransferase n=1 Tax=Salisaeta longa TaxID=503170 RepID=UPI00041FB0D6|nr:class II glutamine amidotransferase [Salisaeta longa]
MCRLYGLQATHPTQAACALLDAQNALIDQSREDARGLSNPDGWGMGRVDTSDVHCFRQVGPASSSPAYREEALNTTGTTLLGHVRRATVGTPAHTNTHPFRIGDELLIHNGHVPAFEEKVKPHLLAALDDDLQQAVGGSTDSEHVFAYILQMRRTYPKASLQDITGRAIHQIDQWVPAGLPDDMEHTLALNLLWTDGTQLVGSRLNRSLWRIARTAPFECPMCGEAHAHPGPAAYRSVTVASERITDEDWTEVPNATVFSVTPNGIVQQAAL